MFMEDANVNNVSKENQYPGEESITTDDLIFSIGEKEVDLQRKKRAINNLVKQLQNSFRQNKDLLDQLDLKENEVKQKERGLSKTKENFEQEKLKEIEEIKKSFEQTIDNLIRKQEKQRNLINELRKENDILKSHDIIKSQG
jgi:hypothetical protein